jgi:hypothetical protein
MKKFIGKPYAGKPHVRIDEGAGEVFLSFPALLYRSDKEEHGSR